MYNRISFFPLLFIFLSACTAPPPAPPTLPTSSPPPLSTASPSLHPPDPATLVRVLNFGISLEREAWAQFDYPTFHGDFLTSPEARGLFDFIQADLDRYYPDGLPHAWDLFANGSLDPNIWFPPRAVWTLSQAGIVEFLRTEGLKLTDGVPLFLPSPGGRGAGGEGDELRGEGVFTLLPTALELDGDPAPEWLVEVTSESYNLHGWFPLDNDGYTLIPNEIQHDNLARAQGLTLHLTPDLNGDGLGDLLIHFDGQPLGTQFGELKVYGTAAGKIILLEKIPLMPGAAFDYGNSDGEGAADLRVTFPRTYNFGCEWVQTNVYEWRGGKNHDFPQEAPPDTPLCNASQSLAPDRPFPPENGQTAEGIIQSVTPLAPSQDYLALLHVRLAMDYAGQLEDARAGEILDQLPQFQNSSFAALAYQKWADSARSPVDFCSALAESFRAGEMEQTGLAPYFHPTALFQAYGNRYESAAPFICAPETLLHSRAWSEKIPADKNPVQFLTEKNYPILGAAELHLDGDPESEWVAGLSTRYPAIFLFDSDPAGWKITTPYGFSAPLQTLAIRVENLRGDDAPDLIWLATFAPSVPVSQYPACWEQGASVVSEVGLLQLSGTAPFAVQTRIICGTPPLLSTLSPAEILALIPEPVPPVLSPDDPVFLSILTRHEGFLLRGENMGKNRSGLQALLANIPGDHPAAPHLIPRLLFGIGLSDEIEGDTEAARAAFLDLIAQWPASPWAWLAAARVHETGRTEEGTLSE